MSTNYENAMESVGQAVFEMFGKDTPNEVSNLLTLTEASYVLVTWPESQDYMEEDWFDEEAIFASEIESSAYFIPIKRIL